MKIKKDKQYYKFCAYGFLKNLRFFEPFFLLFLLEKGFSFTQIGVLFAIRSLLINFLEIPTGVISDSIGRKRAMLFSFGAYIVSFVIFYVSNSFLLFVFAMIFFSFGETFRSGTHKAMIMEYLKLKNWESIKVNYYGHTRSASQIGSAISSLIAASLVFYTNSYSIIFLASTIPYILDLLNLATYPAELDGEVKKLKWNEVKKQFVIVLKETFYSFKNRRYIKILINSSFYAAYYKSLKDYIQPIIKTMALGFPFLLAYDNKQRAAFFIGIIYFFVYLINSFASRKASAFQNLFKDKDLPLNLTMFFGFFLGILTGFFYEFNIYYLSILFFIFISVIENVRKPMAVSKVSDEIDSKNMATGLSVESQLESIFTSLIVFMTGFFADLFNVGVAILIVSFSSVVFGYFIRVED